MSTEDSVEIEQTLGEYTIRVRCADAKAAVKQLTEAAKALGASGVKLVAPSKAKSLTEFMNSLRAQSDVDRTVCCAYFLQTYRKIDSITTKDLRGAYLEAKLPKSSNPSDAISANVTKGYLAPTGKKKEGYDSYYVTTDGLAYIESGLKPK